MEHLPRLTSPHTAPLSYASMEGGEDITAKAKVLRMAIRAIEVRSRRMEDVKVRAGFLGAIEVVKLIALTQCPDAYQDICADADVAGRLMKDTYREDHPELSMRDRDMTSLEENPD